MKLLGPPLHHEYGVSVVVVAISWLLLFSPAIVRPCYSFKAQNDIRHYHHYHHVHQRRQRQTTSSSTSLFGIEEWRDQMFDFPGTGEDRRLGKEDGGAPKEVCILPFPYDEVLLQGETKQLRLYEDRFLKLFDDAMENHNGIVAMGLLAESGIIQTCPLAEIEAYNRLDGFGIFVTIRVVSRVQLVDITKQEPFLKAVCKEMSDTLPPNLEIPNLLATNIENFVTQLSDMEKCIADAEEKEAESSTGNGKNTNSDMQQRKLVAKLDDRFYDDLGDDEEGEIKELDRCGRFKQAYQVALSTDTQGYRVTDASNIDRTPQDLAAISWASFCTEIFPEADAAARIQALDTDSLLERLKLASLLLKEKKNKLMAVIKKNDIKFKGDEFDEEF